MTEKMGYVHPSANHRRVWHRSPRCIHLDGVDPLEKPVNVIEKMSLRLCDDCGHGEIKIAGSPIEARNQEDGHGP